MQNLQKSGTIPEFMQGISETTKQRSSDSKGLASDRREFNTYAATAK